MKFYTTFFNEITFLIYKTALQIAVEKRNDDIINLLLSNSQIKTNINGRIFFPNLIEFDFNLLMFFCLFMKKTT